MDTVRWAWRTKIQVHLGIDLRLRLWNAAEQESVRVFRRQSARPAACCPVWARPTMASIQASAPGQGAVADAPQSCGNIGDLSA